MKKCIGIGLFLVAQVTTPIFNLIGILYGSFRAPYNGGFSELDSYYLDMAKSKDQHSNVAMQYLFNDVMAYGEKYRFGHMDETISSAFGKNKLKKALTRFGRFWARFLNRLDENHVENAVDETVNNEW